MIKILPHLLTYHPRMRGTRHQIVKIGSESDSRPRNHLNSGIVRDWAKIMAIFSIFKMASSGDPILPPDKDRHSIHGGHVGQLCSFLGEFERNGSHDA